MSTAGLLRDNDGRILRKRTATVKRYSEWSNFHEALLMTGFYGNIVSREFLVLHWCYEAFASVYTHSVFVQSCRICGYLLMWEARVEM